jgi:hypothetical protein
VVPESFNEFFAACAGVSGALIGLLFVAISVSPEKLTGEGENIEHQIKAGAAFSALINTLLLALFALIPDNGLGEPAVILAGVGLASTAGLLIFFLRNRRRQEPIGPGQILLLAGTFALYLLQLMVGAQLWRSPPHRGTVGHVTSLAEILIVFFIIAIARAWGLLGARDTGLVSTVVTLARERHEGGERDAVPGTDGGEGGG